MKILYVIDIGATTIQVVPTYNSEFTKLIVQIIIIETIIKGLNCT